MVPPARPVLTADPHTNHPPIRWHAADSTILTTPCPPRTTPSERRSQGPPTDTCPSISAVISPVRAPRAAQSVIAGAAGRRPTGIPERLPRGRPAWPSRPAAQLWKRDGTRNSWRPRALGRYARAMEISPNWGNFPQFRVQVPPRTQLHVSHLRLFPRSLSWVGNAAGQRHGSSSPSRTLTLCACCDAVRPAIDPGETRRSTLPLPTAVPIDCAPRAERPALRWG